jgi:hypothetical protein
MARIQFKNMFGAETSAQSLDLQRTDLWKVTLNLPAVIGVSWKDNVEFLVENFPFPERSITTIEIKYLQQTNYLIGHDNAGGQVDMRVRLAYGTRALEALEKWLWLVSNPKTGGVGLTSQCKAKGYMRWLVPNMAKQVMDLRGNAESSENTLSDGIVYVLEGCLIRGLKLSDADMSQSNYVTATLSMTIDRYYPENINRLVVTPAQVR